MQGDTFTFVLPTKIGYIANQFNSLDENIQFTFEMDKENKLAFLDVMVSRNTNETINTVYCKPTNKDIHINWHSHSSLLWKRATANVLIQRASRICSDKKVLGEKLDIIKQNLCRINNYPRKFVQNIRNYNLHKRNRTDPNITEGNNSKDIFIIFI